MWRSGFVAAETAVIPLTCARVWQVISDLRAKLSNSFYPTNVLNNDDQGILTRDGSSVILVPSNGYTFERTPTQVRELERRGHGGPFHSVNRAVNRLDALNIPSASGNSICMLVPGPTSSALSLPRLDIRQ